MEVLNLATSESFSGPSLPAPDSSGCAAFDSNSNYVYYVEGEDGVDDGAAVFRIAGELCGGGKGGEEGGACARGCVAVVVARMTYPWTAPLFAAEKGVLAHGAAALTLSGLHTL